MDPAPGPGLHSALEPARDGDQRQEVEADRPQPERQAPVVVVVGDERHDQVLDRHPSGLVQHQGRDVEQAEGKPEDGCELVRGAHRPVVGKAAQDAGAQRHPGHQRDGEGGEGAEAGDPAEDPEKGVEGQGYSHQPGQCSPKKYSAASRPIRKAVLA